MSHERMPPIAPAAMSDEQKSAAQALSAGPRGGVKGPFVPLLRSPQLMDRLQKVGEYLRFHSALEPRVSEFVVLLVSRRWTQQFEWAVHAPLALKAGVAAQTVESLAEGRRPIGMARDEEIAYDLCDELWRNHGVSDGTYGAAVDRFGEPGLVDLLGLVGYFTTVSMVMNAVRTPRPSDAAVSALASLPS